MSKTFFPTDFELVPATHSSPDIEYKVSFGMENWNDHYREVFKVQLVQNGSVLGRYCPSFPANTDDYLRVHEAMMRLYNKHHVQV